MASHHSFCAVSPLRIGLRTKILYELAETRCIERIEGVIQSFDPVRVFDNVSIDSQVREDRRAKIGYGLYPYRVVQEVSLRG